MHKDKNMTRTWRVGVMGLGHWYSGVRLAQALPQYDKAELVAVAALDEAKAQAFGDMFAVPAYTDYDQFLAEADLDMLHISPPSAEMRDRAVKAAQAGKHFVLGKPIAMNLEEADDIIAAVEQSDITCVTYQGLRRLADANLKRQLDEGLIGEVKVIHITYRVGIAEDWIDSGSPGWFADPRQSPGGSFADEGTYALERLMFLTGSHVVEVSGAKVGNFVHPGLETEDWAMGTFTFGNGIIATIESAWTISVPRLSGPSPKENNLNRMEIVGSEGEMLFGRLYTPGDGLLNRDAPYWTFSRPMPRRNAPARPSGIDYLIRCVEEGEEPVTSLHAARETLAVVLATYECARTGAPVRLS
jgi:predicted dehydrogenase